MLRFIYVKEIIRWYHRFSLGFAFDEFWTKHLNNFKFAGAYSTTARANTGNASADHHASGTT